VNLDEILVEMVEREGSDLHIKSGRPPLMRISGELLPTEHDPVSAEEIHKTLLSIMDEKTKATLEEYRDVDFSYEIADKGRFRVNAFFQRANVGAVLRYIPVKIPSIEEMDLPPVLNDLAIKNQGLILVTGPTGSGKSTTLAAMINHINETRPAHIMTIEDPIEFVYEDNKATINQREVGKDSADFKRALRAALRQDPDVILMGEMRDQESVDIALHAAETGHLVFSTLHTNDAAQTIDRIMNLFPAEAQANIRQMLALVLCGIISQRLVRRADGTGRAAAVEVMINSPNIKDLIEEGATSHMPQAMAKAGSFYRMQTLNQALAKMVRHDAITQEVALATSSTPDDLKLLLKGFSTGSAADPTTVAKKKADVEQAAAKEEPQEEKKDAEPAKEGGAGKLKITRGFKM
jgi:twitching motility protein PilT